MTTANILVIGGSTRPDSSGELAARIAGRGAESVGADVTYILGRDLMLPIYDTETPERTEQAKALIAAMRSCDGIIVVSPGYHGGISGMIKNALDYAEDMNKDTRVYLDGCAFGSIAVAYGAQATVTTLHQLRQVAHALRAWPTPLGGSINSASTSLKAGEEDEAAVALLDTIGRQVAEFAMMRKWHAVQG
jgi:FMN reductase